MFKKYFLSIFLFALLFIPLVFAQEHVEEEDWDAMHKDMPEEASRWVWGEVVSVGSNQLTVKHTDYETGSEGQMIIAIASNTEFENAGSLREIKIGDYISADYEEKGGQKVATFIMVEKAEDIVQTEEQPEM